jgi:COMPASS component SWD3
MNRTGTLLLSSSKDNSNRVWDLRMMRPHLHLALRGHRNSTKNFIRCAP